MNARFKVGDRVRIVRVGIPINTTAVVSEVHTDNQLIPHYALDFGNGPLVWLPEFDLAAAKEEGRSQSPSP